MSNLRKEINDAYKKRSELISNWGNLSAKENRAARELLETARHAVSITQLQQAMENYQESVKKVTETDALINLYKNKIEELCLKLDTENYEKSPPHCKKCGEVLSFEKRKETNCC